MILIMIGIKKSLDNQEINIDDNNEVLHMIDMNAKSEPEYYDFQSHNTLREKKR